jgi:hypothetical protein
MFATSCVFLISFTDVYILFKMLQIHDCFVVVICVLIFIVEIVGDFCCKSMRRRKYCWLTSISCNISLLKCCDVFVVILYLLLRARKYLDSKFSYSMLIPINVGATPINFFQRL